MQALFFIHITDHRCSLHMFAVSLASYSSMENPSNCFCAPEPGSVAKAEGRGVVPRMKVSGTFSN